MVKINVVPLTGMTFPQVGDNVIGRTVGTVYTLTSIYRWWTIGTGLPVYTLTSIYRWWTIGTGLPVYTLTSIYRWWTIGTGLPVYTLTSIYRWWTVGTGLPIYTLTSISMVNQLLLSAKTNSLKWGALSFKLSLLKKTHIWTPFNL